MATSHSLRSPACQTIITRRPAGRSARARLVNAAPASWKNIVPNRLIARSKPSRGKGWTCASPRSNATLPRPCAVGEPAGALDRRCGDVHAQRTAVVGGEGGRAGGLTRAAADVEDPVARLDVTGLPEHDVEPLQLGVVARRVLRATRVHCLVAPAHQAS